jgi:hypothetical protein
MCSQIPKPSPHSLFVSSSELARIHYWRGRDSHRSRAARGATNGTRPSLRAPDGDVRASEKENVVPLPPGWPAGNFARRGERRGAAGAVQVRCTSSVTGARR